MGAQGFWGRWSFGAVLVAVGGLGLGAAHADGTEFTQGSQVQSLYESPLAATPDLASVEGWWTGRCFKTANPAAPVASLLAVFENMAGSLSLIALNNPYAEASYYDEPPAREVIGHIYDEGMEVSPVRVSTADHSLYSTFERGNIAYHVLQRSGYLVGRMSYLHDSVNHRAGGVWGYCYWFRRVR